MKFIILSFIVVVALGVWGFYHFRSKATSPLQSKTSSSPALIYQDLRNQVLHGSHESFGLDPTSNSNEPWGVLMETGYPEGSATLVAVSDGNASVYLSSGGGDIGGGGHEKIRKAAIEMVVLASKFQTQMKITRNFPLPKNGETIFYLLTDSGVFTASASENDLGEQRHLLSPLFNAGHEIIGQYRMINGKK